MSDHAVTLLFSDGASHRMRVETGVRLVEAATNEGLTLLTDCSNGQCGTCVAQLCSGQVAMDDFDSAVLPDDEREAGSILPCVCRITDDCVVELPYEFAEACQDEPEVMEGRVLTIQRVAEETVQMVVEVDAGFPFEAGQYVRIRPLGAEDWRSYSMANPSGDSRLVFYIRLVPGGQFSDWLSSNAAPGSALELSAPRGSFFLRRENRPRLFVAGGTGLAPFIAMLAEIDRDPTQRALATTLVMGVRTAGHLFAQHDLQEWMSRLPNLSVHLVSEQGGIASGRTGYPTDLIADLQLDPRTRVYLCGPPPMVEAGRAACTKAGINRSEILCERFA